MNIKTPNHQGIEIGKVIEVYKDSSYSTPIDQYSDGYIIMGNNFVPVQSLYFKFNGSSAVNGDYLFDKFF